MDAPFKVGDKVTSKYYDSGDPPDESDFVRTVVGVAPGDQYMSGWGIHADGGNPCPTCGHLMGRHVPPQWGEAERYADTSWFKKA
jgi:hypothetical protein